jgi:hypothetical protein
MDILNFVGALNRNKAQQKAYKQSQQAYQNFLGPHVDYHLGDNPTTVQGLTPTQPVETAGFRPEEQLTKSVNTPPMADGGLPRLPSLPPAWSRGALSRPLSSAPPSLPWGPSRPPPSGEFPRGLAAAGQVGGDGGGQDDRVPAYLSQDEYVVPADVVSHLGDGSSNEGARRLDELVSRVRERRGRGDGLPPRIGALSNMVGRGYAAGGEVVKALAKFFTELPEDAGHITDMLTGETKPFDRFAAWGELGRNRPEVMKSASTLDELRQEYGDLPVVKPRGRLESTP